MTRSVDILVIAAHPDDAEFGAAGTVAKWIREGRSSAYLVCTSGEKGTTDRSLTPEELTEIREEEQRANAFDVKVRLRDVPSAVAALRNTPYAMLHSLASRLDPPTSANGGVGTP